MLSYRTEIRREFGNVYFQIDDEIPSWVMEYIENLEDEISSLRDTIQEMNE